MDIPANDAPTPTLNDSPRRRLRRQLTRQVLAAVAEAAAGRTPVSEVAAQIVAAAECYAAILAGLDAQSGDGRG